MIRNYGIFNHTGLVVENFDTDVAANAALFGWDMAPARVIDGAFLVYGEKRQLSFRVAWSFDGPPHFEFVEAVPNTPLQPTGVHHVAFWTDDLNAAIEEYAERGYKVVLTRIDENGVAPYRFAYVENPDGIIIELMDSAFQHVFEEYLEYRDRRKKPWTGAASD